MSEHTRSRPAGEEVLTSASAEASASGPNFSRRTFLKSVGVTPVVAAAIAPEAAEAQGATVVGPDAAPLTLTINGQKKTVTVEPRTTLLDAMRQQLDLTGAKRVCDRVTDNLIALGINASAIHGDLPQPSREKALRRFAEGSLSVLVATDVAARGIDIDDIAAVIHYEPAKDNKDYLHRSGRTARAGRDGWAVTLVEYNQHTQVTILQRTMRMPITKAIEVFSNNPKLSHLADFLD